MPIPDASPVADPAEGFHPEIINPDSRVPVMLICDHASSRIPARYGTLGLPAGVLEQHVGVDVGIAEVTRELAVRLGVAAVLSPCSRLLVDCNRWVDDPRNVLEESDGIRIPGNIGLSAAERAVRQDAWYWPYHRAAWAVCAGLRARTMRPILLSLHSCTRQLVGEDPRLYDGGTIWHEDSTLSSALIAGLAREGLTVSDNEPYSGIGGTFSIDYHSWDLDMPACGLEIVNDALTSAQGRERWVAALMRALNTIIADRLPVAAQ